MLGFPACPKCENTSFNLTELIITGASHKYQAVTCMKCNCIITVLPYDHTNTLIYELAAKLGVPFED